MSHRISFSLDGGCPAVRRLVRRMLDDVGFTGVTFCVDSVEHDDRNTATVARVFSPRGVKQMATKKHCRRESRYVSILVVYVHDARSLIDSLRYDRCCPATEVESGKILRLMSENDDFPDHVIRLHRFGASEMPADADRWRSYGCRVLDERSPEAEQLTDAQILDLARALR